MPCRYLLFIIAPAVLISCKKDKGSGFPPSQQQKPVLLKEIVIPNLPSPYYHFEYNTAGRPTFASFASGFFMYDIAYNGGRISEMKNNIIVNKDRLQYSYDNAGRVTVINYTDEAGNIFKRSSFFYNGQKLTKIERELKLGGSFVIEKTTTLTYHPDGNLQKFTEHRPAIPATGQTEARYSDLFEQYDKKINADGFTLLHNEFFEHLVLLPGVQLQKNNPAKLIHTGDGVNYQIDYTYTYNDKNLPLTKTGDALWLNGADAGKRFQTNSLFTYY